MNHPRIWSLEDIVRMSHEGPFAMYHNEWLPPRPLGYPSLRNRIKATWLVFTGRADALRWPEDKEVQTLMALGQGEKGGF